MVLRIQPLVLLGAGLLLLGCANRDAKMFQRLYESDLSLGIRFELSDVQSQGILGEPTAVESLQGGANVTNHYLPPDVTETTSDTPQLAVTFLDDSLVRCFNRWLPEDPEQPLPPFFMEPLPGVKLGNRKSDFVTALGRPTDPIAGNEWRFEHKDGRKILVTATFSENPSTNDLLCTVLQIVLIPALPELQGEQAEKNADWRKRVGME